MTELTGFIRDVPDFPKAGIVFKDITPLLRDGEAFGRAVRDLAEYVRARKGTVIAGIEARGFIFGAAVAAHLGLGFVPVRKKGKLPWKTAQETYALEYGEDTVEVHEDAAGKGDSVVVIDDLLATGGTLAAACRLFGRLGAAVVGCACVIELKFLDGRARLPDVDFHTLIAY